MFLRSLKTRWRIIAVYVVVVVAAQTAALDRVGGEFTRPRPDGGPHGNSVTSLSPSSRTPTTQHRPPHDQQRHDDPSSPPFLRSYMSATLLEHTGRQPSSINGISPPPRPMPPPPPPGRDEDKTDEAPPSSSSSRWCYICSGKFPDRECELYPKRVTRGPAKTNCTKGYCTSYVRYKPKSHLIVEDDNKKPVAVRPLEPDDFDVTSIARECESFGRGNTCILDGDQLGVTCYSSCTTDFCNDDTRRPGWEHFRHSRFHQDRNRQQSEDEEEDDDGESTSPTSRREDAGGKDDPHEATTRRRTDDEGGKSTEAEFRGTGEDENTGHGQQQQQQRGDLVARSLPPETNEIVRGPFGRDTGRHEPPGRMTDSGMPDYSQMERDSENMGPGPQPPLPPPHHRPEHDGPNADGRTDGPDAETNKTTSGSKNLPDGGPASSSETAKSKSGKNQLSSSGSIVRVTSPSRVNAMAVFCVVLMFGARRQ